MALGIEKRQVSLIGGDALPQARATAITPDLSGLQRLGQAFMNQGQEKYQEQKAEERRLEAEARANERQLQGLTDSREGAAAAGAYVGMDEKGNYLPMPEMTGDKSPEYWRAFGSAFDQGQSTLFQTSLTEAFAPIQADFIAGKITAETANAKMKSWLEGAVSKAPAVQRSAWAEAGSSVIGQRYTTMQSQETAKIEKARVDGVSFSISDNLDKAGSMVAAGGDPAAHVAEIDKGYDTLVGMNLMTVEEATARKAGVRNYIGSQALVNGMTTAMAKGELDPASVDAFGTALETNNSEVEITGKRAYQVGPGAKSSIDTAYKAKDAIAGITDPKVRNDVGLMLRKAAEQYKQDAAAVAKAREFSTAFDNLDPKTSLPDKYKDDFNVLMTGFLQKNPIEDQRNWGTIFAAVGKSKVVPKVLEDQMMGLVSSNDPGKISEAVQLYAGLKSYTLPDGTVVGDKILDSMSDDAASKLEAVSQAARLNIPLPDVVENIRKARDNNLFSESNLREDWNKTHTGSGSDFSSMFSTKFQELYGSGSFPNPDIEQSFTTAYRNFYMVTGDRDEAFTQAMDLVKKRYTQSPVTANGYEYGAQTLQNPLGYEERQYSFGGLVPGQSAEYEWINRHIAEQVWNEVAEGNIVMPMTRDGEMTSSDFRMLFNRLNTDNPDLPGAQESGGSIGILPGDNIWLGKDKSGVLVPVEGSNPQYPEYKIRMFKDGEDLGFVNIKNADGSVQPMVINPHLDKLQFQDRNEKLFGPNGRMTAREQLKTTQSSVQDALNQLKEETLGRLSTQQQGDFDPEDMTFQQYLDAVAPELAGRYQARREDLIKGFEDMKQKIEDNMQMDIPTEPFESGSLVAPQAAGKNVASAAAQVVDSITPDGSGGAFLFRVAAQESTFGTAPGSFRLTGDRGMTQISSVGLKEINRRTAIQGDRVNRMAVKLQSGLAAKGINVNLMNLSASDLDKPVVAMAAARLYMEVVGKPLPADIEGQARWWKTNYNTYLGAGTAAQFVRNATAAGDDWKSLTVNASFSPEGATSGPVSLRYANAGKRNLKVQPMLERQIKAATASVLGPGYTAEIFSGAQKPGVSSGMTGSRRHGDKEMQGLAADVYFYDPKGKRVTDRATLLKIRDYWRGNDIGSVGKFMTGMGMHLDLFTASMLGPNESVEWDY